MCLAQDMVWSVLPRLSAWSDGGSSYALATLLRVAVFLAGSAIAYSVGAEASCWRIKLIWEVHNLGMSRQFLLAACFLMLLSYLNESCSCADEPHRAF